MTSTLAASSPSPTASWFRHKGSPDLYLTSEDGVIVAVIGLRNRSLYWHGWFTAESKLGSGVVEGAPYLVSRSLQSLQEALFVELKTQGVLKSNVVVA